MSAIEGRKAGLVQRRFDRIPRRAGLAFVGNRVAVIGWSPPTAAWVAGLD
jgi:hypothetical protein